MPTDDQKVSGNTAAATNQSASSKDDFDLDILGPSADSNISEPEKKENDTLQEATTTSQSDSFDLGVDLPDDYSSSVPEKQQEHSENKEDNQSENVVDDIADLDILDSTKTDQEKEDTQTTLNDFFPEETVPQDNNSDENTENKNIQEQSPDTSNLEDSLPTESDIQPQDVPSDSTVINEIEKTNLSTENSEALISDDIVTVNKENSIQKEEKPQEGASDAFSDSKGGEDAVNGLNSQEGLNFSNSDSGEPISQTFGNTTEDNENSASSLSENPMLEATHTEKESQQEPLSGDALLFSENAPSDVNLTGQTSEDVSLETSSTMISDVDANANDSTLSDALKFQQEVTLSDADNQDNPLQEPSNNTMDLSALMNESNQNVDFQGDKNQGVTQISTEQNQADQEAQGTGEQTPQTQLNLDEMVDNKDTQAATGADGTATQDSQGEQEVDPFMAMKSTLEGKTDAQFQTLDLNTMTQAGSSSVDGAQVSQNPIGNLITNPSANYSQVGKTPATSKKSVTILGSVVLLIAVAAIGYIRYPDLFAGILSPSVNQPPVVTTTTNPNPADNENDNTQQNPEESTTSEETGDKEHGSATGEAEENTIEIIPEVDPVEVTGGLIEDSSSIPYIDLSDGSSTMSSSNTSTEGGNSDVIDPFAGVEDLVGPINNQDALKQEIMSYQKRGQEMKDIGAARNDVKVMRQGNMIEGKSATLLERLENGEDITTVWGEQKEIFDGYLSAFEDAE